MAGMEESQERNRDWRGRKCFRQFSPESGDDEFQPSPFQSTRSTGIAKADVVVPSCDRVGVGYSEVPDIKDKRPYSGNWRRPLLKKSRRLTVQTSDASSGGDEAFSPVSLASVDSEDVFEIIFRKTNACSAGNPVCAPDGRPKPGIQLESSCKKDGTCVREKVLLPARSCRTGTRSEHLTGAPTEYHAD